MGKKKVEHIVFDEVRKIKKKINISEYNKKSHLEKNKRLDIKNSKATILQHTDLD